MKAPTTFGCLRPDGGELAKLGSVSLFFQLILVNGTSIRDVSVDGQSRVTLT